MRANHDDAMSGYSGRRTPVHQGLVDLLCFSAWGSSCEGNPPLLPHTGTPARQPHNGPSEQPKGADRESREYFNAVIRILVI
jgi:hypothetical protein